MGIWEYNCLQLGKMRSNDGLDVGILMTKNATCLKFCHLYLSKKVCSNCLVFRQTSSNNP